MSTTILKNKVLQHIKHVAIAMGLLAGLAGAEKASAIPSFARQTSMQCAMCHTAFPELTPFGRRFKLNGYKLSSGESKLPPFAMMLLPTFTHTAKSQDAPPAAHTSTNDNLVLQQASLFYGGQIYGNVGGFVQMTYDRVAQRFFLDNTDIRYADTATILGKDTVYGVTLNNSPTVQDVWNTTAAWGFPEVSSTLGPQFSPPGTMLDGRFAQSSVGVGAYAFWNDSLYGEISGYQTFSKRGLTTLGEPDPTTSDSINGVAPYWRLAYEPSFGNSAWMFGTFGMIADITPGRMYGYGYDHVSDFGVDSQYQYSGDMDSFTLKATRIVERQKLNSSFAQGASSYLKDHLTSAKLSGSWVRDHTYSLSAAVFDVSGTSDPLLYGVDSGNPAGRGYIFDAAYLPFSHGGPSFWPWANARIGVSYTLFTKLYGGTDNFDGAGHNAKDNNTLFAYSWIAF